MKNIIITFENGNTIHTSINGTDQEIRDYYIGKSFNFGDTEEHPADEIVKAVKVEILHT